jgi:predicted kinase
MESQQPPTRSVKIPEDERTGWSSDRPRRDGAPPRPPSLSVRCRVLTPSDHVRYSPGSLLVIVCPSAAERDRFTEDLIDNRAALLSLDKVRALLAGRVEEEELAERAAEILDAAVLKRLESNETVVLAAEGLGADERERYVRMAAGFKRPRHLIMLDTSRESVQEEDRTVLNDLRSRLDAGELGAEGFQTALRLGGESLTEIKRIVFQRPPRDD